MGNAQFLIIFMKSLEDNQPLFFIHNPIPIMWGYLFKKVT